MTDANEPAGRTTQLRRYRLMPNDSEAFVAWWRTRLLPAREAFGFTLEFAVSVPANDEFVWAVSAPGDAEAFRALDAAWTASPERAAAFAGEPVHVRESTLELADRIG